MQRRTIGAVLLVLLLLGVAGGAQHATVEDADDVVPSHFALFSQAELYTGLEDADRVAPLTAQVYGGIVSHHFYVEKYIAEFFLAMRNQRPGTVVILSPNHFNSGDHKILLSQYPYDTPWGRLMPDVETSKRLLAEGVAYQQEQPFNREHGISTLVGFLKYALPDTQVVPIMLKRSVTSAEVQALGEQLNALLPQDSLVIASVDFSHHLNRVAASFHDAKSIAAIANFDFQSVATSEVDSPQSITALLTYLTLRGAQHLEYTHTDSALVGHNLESEDVTSYLFGHFTKGQSSHPSVASLIHFGDAMFDRGIGKLLQTGKDPFASIVGPEGNFFRGTDATILNLEGPLTARTNCPTGEARFAFSPNVALLLKKNKVNVVNVANNHAMDCGAAGLQDTLENLEKANVAAIGSSTHRSYTLTVGARNIALLGINALGQTDEQEITARVRRLRTTHDAVIVHVHWGVEYNTQPSPAQIDLAHLLVDSGATTVFGHHPHVIQPMEVYKKSVIFYSLGNFIFDQALESARQGLGVGSVFSDDKVTYHLFPFANRNYFPTLLSYMDMKTFCDTFLQGIAQVDTCTFSVTD